MEVVINPHILYRRNRLLLDIQKSDLKTQKALLEQQAEMDKKYENWKKEVEEKLRREKEEMEKRKDEALKTSTSSVEGALVLDQLLFLLNIEMYLLLSISS